MNGYAFAALLLFVLAISIFSTLYKPAAEFIKDAFLALSELGWIGYVLLLTVEATTVVCAIPIIIPNMALSALFSFPVAFIISMIGYSIGISVVYGMMAMCKWEPSDTFRRLHGVMRYEPYKYTLLARFIVMPSALKNYGLASCPISYVCYMVCGFVHGMYVNALQIVTAYQLWHADSLISYLIMGGTFLVGMASLVLFSYLAHRAITRAESELLIREQEPER